MRRTELIIAQSRRTTGNTEFSDDTGYSDDDFIQYLNDAQDRVFSRILSVYPNINLTEEELDAVPNQQAYAIPLRAYLQTKLEFVEYSRTGQDKDYYTLEKGRPRERYNGHSGMPRYVIRRGRNILLNPAPSSAGKIRFNYYEKLPKMDKRRGVILAATIAGTQLTALTLDTNDLVEADITAMVDQGYICVVDKDGVIQMKGIPITGIDIGTGIVTLFGGAFTFEEGDTVAVGDYVVSGEYSSSHSHLDDAAERYLQAHCDWKALKGDSSIDSAEASAELNQILSEIIDTYKDVDEDVEGITILDTDYLTFT